MQLAAGLAFILLLWLAVRLYGHGYANVLDSLALLVHRHARTVREMQREETGRITQEWVRELEQ